MNAIKRADWRVKHGASKTPEYRVWISIKSRCLNPRCHAYPLYGGRGIAICESWKRSFSAFLSNVGPRPSSSHWLDRTDNNGNYEPGNCRWVLPKQQGRNRRDNRLIVVDGTSYTVADAADVFNIHHEVLRKRLRMGWEPERAVREPLHIQFQRGKKSHD